MVILMDIGNTTITTGIEDKGRIKRVARIKTEKDKGTSYYKRAFTRYFKDKRIDKFLVDLVLFCSVVPSINSTIREALKGLTTAKIKEAGKDIKINIKNRYRKPKEVGADRLINAVAAHYYYSKSNVIVVDFGTAITFDVINKYGEYLGGLITPGIKTSLKSLSLEAELLPEISLKRTKGLIGRDTRSSINNGIIYTIAFACDGIIKRIKKRFKQKTEVIATGGYAKLISRYTQSIHKIDSTLTLKGLYINYREFMKKNRE